MLRDLSCSISWLKVLGLNLGKSVNKEVLAAPRPDFCGRAGGICPLAAQPGRANTPALLARDAPELLCVLPLPQPSSAQPLSLENARLE